MQEGKEVTCILTSCGRFDLLEKTLESFFKYNTYDIKEFVIYEDSGYKMVGRDKWPFIKWMYRTEGASNQITALDALWKQVKNPYAFTMEDDWEFLKPGFIEASMKVLQADPKVLQCWLHEKDGVQPVEWNISYGILKPSGGLWAGTRFSPALKRKSDYDLIGSYGKYATFDPAKPWKAEAIISQLYHKLGFTGALLPEIYIKHIGENRHVQ